MSWGEEGEGGEGRNGLARKGERGDAEGESRAQLHYTPSLISGISGLQHDVLCSRRINESEVK